MILKAGGLAPDFTATTNEGKSLTLSSLRGHKVLLWFFPEAGTPGCTAEGCGFRDHREYYAENDVKVIGISFDSVEDNAAFARKYGFDFLLLSDTSRQIGIAYGACDDPKSRYPERISFLIGEDGRIARVYDQVNPRDHPARVLADLLGV
ncbi:MAG: peroxiredoxin [Candidatus Binataceae bacterium]